MWGKERDLKLKKMRFRIKGRVLKAIQYSIDVALWIVIDQVEQNFDHKRKACGYFLAFVDDFLLVGPSHVRNAVEEEISRIWKIRMEGQVNQ